MTPKRTDYQERKDLVLGIVVDQYIKTISPVSSAFIAREYSLELSPATIRNILAELESEGYLTHPHTSAGRLPTEIGYRYYVDNLLIEIQLLEVEKQNVKSEYQVQVNELERLLEKASEQVSNLTHYTSIISIDGREDKLFYKGTGYVVDYPETNDVAKMKEILQALEEKERILEIINRELEDQIQVYIGKEIECSEMSDCSMVISRYQSDKGTSGRIAVLGPTRMNYGRVISTVDYISDLMSEII